MQVWTEMPSAAQVFEAGMHEPLSTPPPSGEEIELVTSEDTHVPSVALQVVPAAQSETIELPSA